MSDAADARPGTGSSPYATGGGGTVLEHRFGAILLAHLLTGDPVPGLGDDCDPTEVVFQASSFSAVDDLVIRGRGRDGVVRMLSIGVRRAPSLVPSDAASVRLFGTFLQVVAEQWDAVRQGRWRLQLAATALSPDLRQLHELAAIAHGSADESRFRAAVAQPSRTRRAVRDRLVQIDHLVAAARETSAGDISPSALAWRLLSVLSTRELRLEGADLSDRTECVARLRSMTFEGSVEAADALFASLAERSGRYAPTGASVTEGSLRRDLAGQLDLARSTRHAQARRILETLSGRLRQRTGSHLGGPHAGLELERAAVRQALVEALGSVSPGGPALVITGEPDVGKSALVIKACDLLAEQASVTMLSLRDLPDSSSAAEMQLGASLEELLAGEAVRARRLLVVDGAESVLEGRGALLVDFAAAAVSAGLGVVAVTRSDAAAAVADALRQANASEIGPVAPDEFTVPRLTEAEIDEVAGRFAVLARLGREPRARWLLGRPGLTDLLLRGHAAQALPDGALSEADVFAAVWHALVRHRESLTDSGVSPDAREQALLALARATLLGRSATTAADAAALPSLRSDGLLLAAGPTGAWNPGDQFASDLIRDFCVARLLIVDGRDLLAEADAPRWALRAARLACQGLIAGAGAGADSERVRSQLQQTFDALAEQHGDRWSAVPLEATLTLGSAREVISRAWPALTDGNAHGLIALVRLALQRYAQHGIGDAVVLAPLVEVALEQGLIRATGHGRRDDLPELIAELVLAWLRGRGLSGDSTDGVRAQLRDHLLAEEDTGDEFVVEALALMGSDLDGATEERLRQLAEEGGGALGPAIESVVACRTMVQQRPELLLTLTDAYYIDRPRSRSRMTGGYSLVDDGVRDHTRTHLGAPFAGWVFGPFWWLLHARPADTLRLINELLDHAASIRIAHRNQLWPPGATEVTDKPAQGLTLELPTGPRLCVGNEQVWMWYRGSSNGPYPAMSALMAIEIFADRLVSSGVELGRITELLLRDCHNLAMPGLVVGFLVRHLDRVEDELDPWLVRPEVWELEFARAGLEGHIHAQGPDPTELAGLERRRYSTRDAAMQLVINAILATNTARLETLAGIADTLLANASAVTSEGGETGLEQLTRAGWASCLRRENYRLVTQSNGQTMIEFDPPAEISAGLAPSNASAARGQHAWGLVTRYGMRDDRLAVTDTLPSDLAFVRDLVVTPPDAFGPPVAEVAGAVAATALVRHAGGDIALPAEDLAWATELLVEIALGPRPEGDAIESARYVMGATRSTACGLPALLLDPTMAPGLARHRLREALMACASSPFDEVRRLLAESLREIWGAACAHDSPTAECRHVLALALVNEMLRDCRLGGWHGQRREVNPLTGDPADVLAEVETESLLLNRLTAPLAATFTAARSGACVSGEAQRLERELLTAYRRAAIHWDEEGYGSQSADEHRPVAREMFIAAAAGDPDPLHDCIRAFAEHPGLTEQLMHQTLVMCTYDAELRRSLATVWPGLMRVALDLPSGAAPTGRRGHRAAAALIPRPSLDMADGDPNQSLAIAQADWIDPVSLTELVEEWIPGVRGDANAVDALLGLIRTGGAHWQATVALGWIEDLIAGDYASVAPRSWLLPEWLQSLRSGAALDPIATTRFHRLIDGLVAAGDHRVVALQRSEE